ncbi:hypothetical protein L2734_16505 [Parashewanella spongiae]|nr:hypothetical protein [Parashewanella spongiae]MCL1079744.1 hypothetical protein [Parashewanella spongiae]
MRAALGYKSIAGAKVIIAGIELWKTIKKQDERGTGSIDFVDPYSVAA